MISGRTTQVVVPMIGDPVAQAATPPLWNAHFQGQGIEAVCVPVHLPAAGLVSFVEWVRHARNVPGFLTTVPHKAALPGLCDHLDDEVHVLGVANTVAKRPDGTLACAMFDGRGMVAALKAAGCDLAAASVAICGAGAAGASIAVQAARQGARRLRLFDLHALAAVRLAERLGDLGVEIELGRAQPGDVLVNAAPAGSASPFPEEIVATAPAVADCVTEPEETPLLHLARAHGCIAVPGREMAAHQAALMRAFLGLE